MPQIVPVYTALLTLVFAVLSLRVVQARLAHSVSIGAGGQAVLERRIRAHGNFAEYVPLLLLMMLMLELRGASPALLHGLGIAVLLGRILHAAGISAVQENLRLRQAGMTLTFAPLAVAAVALLVSVLG